MTLETERALDVDIGPNGDPATRKRRRWVWLLIAVVVGGGTFAAWYALLRDGSGNPSPVSTAELAFTEVEKRDLTQVETFAGTLGFDEGDPITTRIAGTITYAVEPGTIAVEGDVLFGVDDQPVAVVQADLPAWRSIGLIPETEQLTLRASGTVTWLAPEGSALEQGDVLLRIDDRPVVVLFGDVPAYRALGSGVEGTDVEQLETALVELGYDPNTNITIDSDFTSNTASVVEDWQAEIGAYEDGRVDLGEVLFVPGPLTVEAWSVSIGDQVGGGAVAAVHTTTTGSEGDDVLALEEALWRLVASPGLIDGVFTEATEAAVMAWQRQLGAEVDGIVDLGEIIFLPGPVRISDRLIDIGGFAGNGSSVLATSTDESVVTVDLPAADQDQLEEGDRVRIEMPNRTVIDGTVAVKATTATQGQQGGQATFDVVIVLDDPAAALGFDQAPVDVEIVIDSAEDVLAVPVTALLALSEGGYAVEVETGEGTTRLVGVNPGMYADGWVELRGNDVSEGDRVVAP